MSYFMDNEDHLVNDQENVNSLDSKATDSNAQKSGKKVLFEAPSKDTLFTLSHALNAFSDDMSYLVNQKGFNHVLTGRGNNDPLEYRFSENMNL